MHPRHDRSCFVHRGRLCALVLFSLVTIACTAPRVRPDPESTQVTNPLAVWFGGPLGCILECGLQKADADADPDSVPEDTN